MVQLDALKRRPVWQVWFDGCMASNGSGSRLGQQEKAAQVL
jgi:hypothetical protein